MISFWADACQTPGLPRRPCCTPLSGNRGGQVSIIRGRQSDPLPAWIDDAIKTDLAPLVRFTRTLNRDFDAVRNAIEMPWSNGQAEGQINRLKTLKRAIYGRAGPELLRVRMLPLRHTD